MNIVRLIDFLRDRLKTVIRLCYAVLALLVLADIVRWALTPATHEAAAEGGGHAAGAWAALYRISESAPGFWSAFGFVACALIIILSKWYGHRGIMTREDYYND